MASHSAQSVLPLELPDSSLYTLDEPDLQLARSQRMGRTRASMKAVNAEVTNDIMPETSGCSAEERAATRIQAQYRGHLGRREYVNRLYQQFEQDEKMRLEKTLKQVEEGQLLVENHRLQVQLDENATTRRNRTRQYQSNVITIQRAWRAFVQRRVQRVAANNNNMCSMLLSDASDEADSCHGAQAMSVSTTPEDTSDRCLRGDDSDPDLPTGSCSYSAGAPGAGSAVYRRGYVNNAVVRGVIIEAEPDSAVSDYSEMADPIKEHLANVQIIHKEDLDAGNTMFPREFNVQQKITQAGDETDEQFSKRLRKINYLSLAQEFAALKRIDADALPFDLHRGSGGGDASPMSDGSTETDSSGRGVCESGGASAATTPLDPLPGFTPAVDDTQTPSGGDGGEVDMATKFEQMCIANAAASATEDWGVTHTTAAPDNKTKSSILYDSPPKKDVTQKSNSTAKESLPKAAQAAGSEFHTSHSPSKASLSRAAGAAHPPPAPSTARAPQHARPSAGDTSAGKSTVDGGMGDFDVYNIETALPQLDWALLEQQLQRAAQEEREKSSTRHNDREEIRRKLAMGSTEEEYYGGERLFKKPNLQTRLQSGMNLQICFMNEATCDPDPSADTRQAAAPQQAAPAAATKPEAQKVAPRARGAAVPGGAHTREEEEEDLDFFSQQAKLQAEAHMALAQVRPMAHMQLEIERQMRKKSPIAEIVRVGIPGFGDGKKKKMSRPLLQQMNLAQLQVVVNDLHAQIESLNEELVMMLVERDDLHMAQDSMLVDIEDHTRRAQECSNKVNKAISKKRERRK